ncbi:calcium homeostasis modulator protein 5-like [Pseudorasbora parva]|uniref:calcium homeostasis modulator protein 5-like n=1 Tax=Pseudorasbora parva TaxID=51549 RepID=UPI00351E2A7C
MPVKSGIESQSQNTCVHAGLCNLKPVVKCSKKKERGKRTAESTVWQTLKVAYIEVNSNWLQGICRDYKERKKQPRASSNFRQKMSFQEKLSEKFPKRCAALGSVLLTIWLIGLLYAFFVYQFTCPCRNDQNAVLAGLLFTGPAFFIFVVMFHLLRPLRYGWFHCPIGVEDDTRTSCPKAFIFCLIPPVMWISFLLLHGNFVACAMTDWDGVSVYDETLNMHWCKPTDGTQNEMKLQELTRKYVHQSKYVGNVLVSLFSVLSLVIVALYDSCISGKCDHCPSQLLSFCGRKVRHGGGNRQEDVECSSPTISISTHPLMAFSKNE